jgi:hypothetical protein
MQTKWIKIYEDHIWTNKLHTQQFKLEFKTQHQMTASQITEYEDIRNQQMEGIQLADQQCRKLHMGQVPFSTKYKEITNKIELWKAVTTKKWYCKFSQSKLRRLEK